MLHTIDRDHTNADIVRVKKLHVAPVPHVTELRQILDCFDDFHPYKLAFAFMAIQALRPVEVPKLTWRNFENPGEEDLIKKMRHICYKPTNTSAKCGKISMYKEIEKPIYSRWLALQLKGYMDVYPDYPEKRLFSFTKPDTLQKWFANSRRSKFREMPWLTHKSLFTPKGQALSVYRINLYSLRRFAFTFHYYCTFNQDIIALSKKFGHSRPDTTLQYYVFPYDAIGLSADQVARRISIDEFLGLCNPKDALLYDFFADARQLNDVGVPEGQRQLSDFYDNR